MENKNEELLDTKHLRYFIAVAEELHFARAAERLRMEQSPLSRAIVKWKDFWACACSNEIPAAPG